MNKPVEETSIGSNRKLTNIPSEVESGARDQASLPEVSRTPLHRLFCCREGLVGAASQELIAQNRSILRTRLLAISAVSLLGHSLFFIRSLLLEYSFAWVQITPLIILSAGIFLLWKQWDFSDTQLRWLEIVIFGTGLVYLAWVHYLAVVLLAERGDVVITSVAIDQIPQSFFALMVMYGMFIPNTWRRALAVISPMAVTPLLLSLYLWLGHPIVKQVTADTRWMELTRPGIFVPAKVRENLMEEDKTDANAEVQTGTDRNGAETDRGGHGDLPPRTRPPSKLDSEPFEVHCTG